MTNFNFKYPHINIYSEYTKAIDVSKPEMFGKLFVRQDKNTINDLVDSIEGIVLSVHESAEIADPEKDLYIGRLDKYNVGRMVYALYKADKNIVLDDITDFDIEPNNKEYYGISFSELTRLTQEYGIEPAKYTTKNGSINPQKCIKLVLALNATDIVILSLPNYKYISLMSFLKDNGLVNTAGFADVKGLVGRKLSISAVKNIEYGNYNFTYAIKSLAVLKSKELREIFPTEAIYYNPFIPNEAFDIIKAKAPAYIYGKKVDSNGNKKVWQKDSTANPYGNNLNATVNVKDDLNEALKVEDNLPF